MELIFPRPDASCRGVDLDALYGAERRRVGDRPWMGLCMIASLDGSIAVEGRSGGLGNDNDRAVFATLRRHADAVLIGARNAVAEAYRSAINPTQRIGVVTGSGNVNTGTDLFTSGSGFLIMPEDGPPAPDGVDVVRAGTSSVDLALALSRLGDVIDPPSFVQAEGGARLNGGLLDADCIDELNLTIAPLLVGGEGSRVAMGATETLRAFQPAHIVTDNDGYLFTRWIRRTG